MLGLLTQIQPIETPFRLVHNLGSGNFSCVEDNPIALENPQLYLKYHLPILPPLVTWVTLVIFQRRDGGCIKFVGIGVK